MGKLTNLYLAKLNDRQNTSTKKQRITQDTPLKAFSNQLVPLQEFLNKAVKIDEENSLDKEPGLIVTRKHCSITVLTDLVNKIFLYGSSLNQPITKGIFIDRFIGTINKDSDLDLTPTVKEQIKKCLGEVFDDCTKAKNEMFKEQASANLGHEKSKAQKKDYNSDIQAISRQKPKPKTQKHATPNNHRAFATV